MGYSRMMRRAWLTDLRKLALLNCILSFLSVLLPAESLVASVRTLTAVQSDLSMWVMLATVAVMFFVLLVLTFFWAIYHEPARLVIPANLRLLALGAAIVLLVIGFRTFGEWAFGIRDDWSFVTQYEWRTGAQSIRGWIESSSTIREFGASTGIAAAVVYVFFLIALFRQSDDFGRSEAPASKLLAVVAKISVVVAGLILAFLLIRVLLSPYLYSQVRTMATRVGRNPPPFLYLIRDTIRDLLMGACYFTAPFLVYMSIRSGRTQQ